MFAMKKVEEKDVSLLAAEADRVWHEWFPSILSVEQIDYMVEKFQSEIAILSQLRDGFEYYFLLVDENVGGYAGIKFYPDYLYLSKFYIFKDYRGKGYGRKAFDFLVAYAKNKGAKFIRLSVNKYNKPSIRVYEKLGFVRYNSAVRDIGNGYVMDDYDYDYKIEK